jgi:hypothetical protein
MAERRAGQFLVDAMLGAPGATYNSFYRGKTLDPMPPALVLPEVTDLSKWWKGKHRYVDPEGQYVFVYQSTLYGPPFYANTKLVNLDTIRSVWDLLDPKWKARRSRSGRVPTTSRRRCCLCTIIRKWGQNFSRDFMAARWISLISAISVREPIGWPRASI